MKQQFGFQLHRLSIAQLSAVLLIIGLFFGIVAANVFQDGYANMMIEYQSIIFSEIARSDINYNGLFFYILIENLKDFFVFWLLSITVVGIPYMAYKILVYGFTAGFFVSAVAIHYGFKGLLLILIYPFPHGIIYLPVMLLCLYKGYHICRTINYDKRSSLGTITQQLKQNMFLIMVLLLLLLLASFLEAYVGAFFLKKTLNLFT